MLQGTSANHLTTVQPNVTAISNHFMINYMNLSSTVRYENRFMQSSQGLTTAH